MPGIGRMMMRGAGEQWRVRFWKGGTDMMTKKTMARGVAGALLCGAALHGGAQAATLKSEAFGTTTGGAAVKLYTMTAANGVSVSFMSYGGVITKILVPDRAGRPGNVVLGFPTLADYEKQSRKNGLFFGALIGRFANRIANGRFSLDGHEYAVPVNDGPNSLHGGTDGFDDRVWSARVLSSSGRTVRVALTLVSADGDQGYPGRLSVTVTYGLSDDGALSIDYAATTTKPTVLNLTNHSYFTMAGVGAQDGVFGQMLQLHASRYTPVNETLIPTGELEPVSGTPFDFTQPKAIGRDIRVPHEQLIRARGYDHNWVLDGTRDADGLSRAATLWDPVSGREMTCSTTEPGVQVYTSNFLNGTVAGKDAIFRQSDAVTFETQHFPDSPNQASFPTTRLDPGRTFHSRTVFRFGIHS